MTVKADTRVWREIVNLAQRLDGVRVRVGILDDSELAMIGAAHEYGTDTIPQRSWMRQTFERKRAELAALQAKMLQAILLRKISPERAMGLIGAWATGAIKATITSDGNFAPLAPATIAAKKSSKALIDTGQLVNRVTWKIVA